MAEAFVFVKGAIASLERKKVTIKIKALAIFKKTIIDAEALAKQKIQSGEYQAVDTGKMVSMVSSYVEDRGNKIEAGLVGGTEYHKFVELGTQAYAGNYDTGKPGVEGQPPSTGGMKARPALTNAVKELQPKLKSNLKRGIAL